MSGSFGLPVWAPPACEMDVDAPDPPYPGMFSAVSVRSLPFFDGEPVRMDVDVRESSCHSFPGGFDHRLVDTAWAAALGDWDSDATEALLNDGQDVDEPVRADCRSLRYPLCLAVSRWRRRTAEVLVQSGACQRSIDLAFLYARRTNDSLHDIMAPLALVKAPGLWRPGISDFYDAFCPGQQTVTFGDAASFLDGPCGWLVEPLVVSANGREFLWVLGHCARNGHERAVQLLLVNHSTQEIGWNAAHSTVVSVCKARTAFTVVEIFMQSALGTTTGVGSLADPLYTAVRCGDPDVVVLLLLDLDNSLALGSASLFYSLDNLAASLNVDVLLDCLDTLKPGHWTALVALSKLRGIPWLEDLVERCLDFFDPAILHDYKGSAVGMLGLFGGSPVLPLHRQWVAALIVQCGLVPNQSWAHDKLSHDVKCPDFVNDTDTIVL